MNFDNLAQDLIDGKITLSEWQTQMKDAIRVLHRQATAAALGGHENVTPSMWGYDGYLVKQQYAYLQGFVDDIAENPQAWLNGRLLNRMRLYERAAWGTFEEIIKRNLTNQGYIEERRVLGNADHCQTTSRPGCPDLAAKGWQPIGTLPQIGETTCWTNCRCIFEYRKPGPDGEWKITK